MRLKKLDEMILASISRWPPQADGSSSPNDTPFCIHTCEAVKVLSLHRGPVGRLAASASRHILLEYTKEIKERNASEKELHI